ncbi:MAG: hypothetical protein KDI62_15800 [Anaerolineae bacterium]|nr:hypothetical protein [Anaerolineae bacterium]
MTERKKKRRPARERRQRGPIVGIAWYTPEQWDRLKQVAEDADALDDTYDDWLKNASHNLQTFKKRGFHMVKVPLDVEEWMAWCQKNGNALNGGSRAQFTSMKASAMDNDPAEPFVERHIKPRRNPLPFLDKLETLFEAERDKSIPPPYPFDKATNTIRLPRKIEVHLQRLARTGQGIEAVKQVTHLTGAGLRVAKDYVDSLIP